MLETESVRGWKCQDRSRPLLSSVQFGSGWIRSGLGIPSDRIGPSWAKHKNLKMGQTQKFESGPIKKNLIVGQESFRSNTPVFFIYLFYNQTPIQNFDSGPPVEDYFFFFGENLFRGFDSLHFSNICRAQFKKNRYTSHYQFSTKFSPVQYIYTHVEEFFTINSLHFNWKPAFQLSDSIQKKASDSIKKK